MGVNVNHCHIAVAPFRPVYQCAALVIHPDDLEYRVSAEDRIPAYIVLFGAGKEKRKNI